MARKKVARAGDGSWGYGSIRQRGDRWQVRWREHGQRQSLSGYSSEAEARDALEEIHARLRLGQAGVEPQPVRPATSKPSAPRPIAELVADWIEYRHAHKIKSASEDTARWALHLAGPLQTQTITSVSAKWVRDLAQELVRPTPGSKAPDGTAKAKVSGPTAHRVLTLLSGFYSWAIQEGHATDNPARLALSNKDVRRLLKSKYDKDHDRKHLPSWEEVDRLYAAIREADPTVAVYYLLSARAGLRPGECLALRWGDVDLAGRVIRVSRRVRSGKIDTTKSDKPRLVPMGETLFGVLTSWRREQRPTQDAALVCPPPRRVKKDGKLGAAWGSFLGAKSIREAMAAAFTATGIEPADVYDYGRHTFGSITGLDPRVSVWRLQEMMGHAAVTTSQRYVSARDKALSSDERAALG